MYKCMSLQARHSQGTEHTGGGRRGGGGGVVEEAWVEAGWAGVVMGASGEEGGGGREDSEGAEAVGALGAREED
jgi:hypothetical protein